MTKPTFVLEDREVIALYDYFMNRVGYVSYEYDALMILLIRKLREYIEIYPPSQEKEKE